MFWEKCSYNYVPYFNTVTMFSVSFVSLFVHIYYGYGKVIGFLFTSTVVARRVLCAFIRMADRT